jgi:hypothetical protein
LAVVAEGHFAEVPAARGAVQEVVVDDHRLDVGRPGVALRLHETLAGRQGVAVDRRDPPLGRAGQQIRFTSGTMMPDRVRLAGRDLEGNAVVIPRGDRILQVALGGRLLVSHMFCG